MTRRLGVGVARRLRLGVVLLCALCMAAIACASTTQVVRIARVAGSASTTSTDAIQVDDRTRTWEQIVPRSKLPGSAPIIVVLSGINATVSQEISRDKLVPYVNAGEAELVYPAGFDESWNAGGCCGKAAQDNIDDVAFLKVLVAQVDPGHRHPVDLVGYSNGGRLAYRMACSDAGLFDETAVVKAMPQPGCVVNQPLTILQIDSTNDPAVPYQPGDPGRETPAATTEVARLHAAAASDADARFDAAYDVERLPERRAARVRRLSGRRASLSAAFRGDTRRGERHLGLFHQEQRPARHLEPGSGSRAAAPSC
jgi:poly(3-hydroxybutyrate) depolymerase